MKRSELKNIIQEAFREQLSEAPFKMPSKKQASINFPFFIGAPDYHYFENYLEAFKRAGIKGVKYKELDKDDESLNIPSNINYPYVAIFYI